MFEHDTRLEEALAFSRFDRESPFSTVGAYPFELEGQIWPSAEHYYQASKYAGRPYAQTIAQAPSAEEAYRLGNRWFKRKVPEWKSRRKLMMTRALYRIVNEHPAIKQALLDTEEQLLIETSLYGHYWGVGRDQRGENTLGKIWMDIRQKITA